MATSIIIGKNNSNESIDIYDSTDYELIDSSLNSINAVRFLFATYNSLLTVGQVGALIVNYEYRVVTGSFTMDNRTYLQGDVFVSNQNFTLPTGSLEVWNTGYYSTYNVLKPSEVEYFSFYPSDLGENGTVLADNARSVKYEVYDKICNPTVFCASGTYIVQGSDLNTYITIAGERFYVGQVFTKTNSFTFTGSLKIVKQLDLGQFDFWTNGNSDVIYQNYIDSLSNGVLNASEDFKDNFIATHTNYSLPYIQSETAITYDFSSVQASLDVIVNYLGTKNKFIK